MLPRPSPRMDVRGLVLVFLVSSLVGVTSSQCGDRESVEVQGGRRQSDGSLVAADEQRFPPGCYWTSSRDVISGCPDKVNPCLWKCCPEGETIDTNNKCSRSNNTSPNKHLLKLKARFNTSMFNLIHEFPCLFTFFEVESENEYLDERGSLTVQYPDDETELFSAGDFCAEILEDAGSTNVIFLGCHNEMDANATKQKPRLKYLINAIGIIISLPFLIATLVAYAVIPELRNLHGKCLMSHVASLTVAFVCLAVMQLGVDQLSTDGCITAALIAYYSLLASFFWLNVMCFDIWRTFRAYRSLLGPKNPRDNLKFIYYSCYAWGAALLLLCVCATMQFAENIPDNYLRPEFGKYSCWFHDSATRWAYFTGPVGVIIACNVVFFTLTALSIWRIKKQTAVLTECKDSQRNAHTDDSEQRYKLYLKLFLVMGVSWTLEIMAWTFGGPDNIWWITGLANDLVGIPIFIIFVWKYRVRILLFSKLNIRMGTKR